MTNNQRIPIIDSFRAIAIIMVLFFHYASRRTDLYTYGDAYDYFAMGKMGVEFFFMISGFVILFTLEHTNNFYQFWKNRIIRLLPSMIIASLLTFFIFNLFDKELLFVNSHKLKNVVVSCTFIKPQVLNMLTNFQYDFAYTNGSYWSLWPEVQFYAYISLLYVLAKKYFVNVFIIISSLMISIRFLISHIYVKNGFVTFVKTFFNWFDLVENLPYFCVGVVFYLIYKNEREFQKIPKKVFVFILFIFAFLAYKFHSSLETILFIVLFVSLFLMLIYYPIALRFLENKVLYKIGISSYFLYLIHENIGIFIFSKIEIKDTYFQFILPLIVMFVMIVFSYFYTIKIERKISTFFK